MRKKVGINEAFKKKKKDQHLTTILLSSESKHADFG